MWDWGVWTHCHLPVALGRRGGRETPRTGRYAETQKIASSRTLLVQVGPHFVRISSVLFAVCGSGREQERLMLNHVRSLLPPQCLRGEGGYSLGGQQRRQPSFSDQEIQVLGRLGELGRGADKYRLQLFPGRTLMAGPFSLYLCACRISLIFSN